MAQVTSQIITTLVAMESKGIVVFSNRCSSTNSYCSTSNTQVGVAILTIPALLPQPNKILHYRCSSKPKLTSLRLRSNNSNSSISISKITITITSRIIPTANKWRPCKNKALTADRCSIISRVNSHRLEQLTEEE